MEEKKAEEKKVMPKCQTIDCGQTAKFHCPTCEKLGLEPAYFCSQECFKKYWPIHKTYHNKKNEVQEKFKNFKFSGPLRPGKVSPRLTVPDHIKKPDYAYTGYPESEIKSKFYNNVIEVKSFEDLEKMRAVGIEARKVLDYSHTLVKPGITTDEIDRKVHEFIVSLNAYPSPLNYHKFPKSLCTSVNEVICHGIPDDRPLEEGDIVNNDITIYKNGFHLDLNETYHVGKVSESSAFLVEKAYRGYEEALKVLKPGNSYKQIGQVISKYIEDNGLAVTRSYCGHGIGQFFHVAPTVPHYKNNNAPGVMKVGHVFTIEPMINQGTYQDIVWPDDWTAVTADGQRSAQFENTFVITEGGYEILTKRLPESPHLDFNA